MAPSAAPPPETQLPVVPTTKAVPLTSSDHEPTPLEAISHGDLQPGIPSFPTFSSHRRHVLTHMSAVFRTWSRTGCTEGQSGHISVRDPEFRECMWMNPLGRHFGMLTAGDMLLIDIGTGRIVAGGGQGTGGQGVRGEERGARRRRRRRTANAAGYWIHKAVHERRGDVEAVCHAHTIPGRAWSVFARPLEMLTQDVCNFHNAHAVYANYGGIVFGGEEGERIAACLGEKNKAAILMNHGLLTVGSTVDEAGFLFGLLDRSCAIQLQVEAALAGGGGNPGLKKNVISGEEAAYNFRMASERNVLYREAQPDVEMEMEIAGGEEVLARGLEELEVQLEEMR